MNSGQSEPKRIQFELCSAKDVGQKSKLDKKVSRKEGGSSLDPRLREELATQLGIKEIFHMQEVVLSHVLSGASRSQNGDVVLCAPTGSGKTLAYALPIVQDMLDRRMPRLRAIIVVPTRDLAAQVFSVFSVLTKRFGIFVLCVVGSSSIVDEALNVPKAEILIATPGRLVDHINNGDYMQLSDVRYLVLDESDRLLEDSYQQWIDVLMPALRQPRPTLKEREGKYPIPRSSYGLLNIAIRPDVCMRSESQPNVRKILASATQTRNPMRLHKLELRDVCFFEPRDLQQKKEGPVDTSEDKYTVPVTMKEYGWIVEHVEQKPLALLQLLGWMPFVSEDPKKSRRVSNEDLISQGGTKLVFTNSVDSAHRLCRLLEICAYMLGRNGSVLEMCGSLSLERRKYVLDSVRKAPKGENDDDENAAFVVVVCSDVLARGMDILTVDTVINYDVPAHISTYLHRAGRTARAGRQGSVFTLLLGNQVRHFRAMVYEAVRDDKKVRTMDMKIETEESCYRALMARSLACLRQVMNDERYGALAHDDSVPQFMLYALRERHSDDASYAEDEGHDEHATQNDSKLHEVLFAHIGRSLLQAHHL